MFGNGLSNGNLDLHCEQQYLILGLPCLKLTIYSIETHIDASTTDFENIVGKGEIARN